MTTNSHPQALVRSVVLAVVLALLAAGSWWAWMGWDDDYYVDPSTGFAAGPYRAWQVAGCVVTLLVLAALAYLVLHPVAVGVAMTVGFTVSFAATTLPDDDTGLAMVGVVIVLVGMAVASLVLGAVASSVLGGRRRTSAA